MRILRVSGIALTLLLAAGAAMAGEADSMAAASALATASGQPILLDIGASW
jgi:hypothetical protein